MAPEAVILALHLRRTNHRLMGSGLEEDVRWRRRCAKDLVMGRLRLHHPQTRSRPNLTSHPYEPPLGRAVEMALEHPLRLSWLEVGLPAGKDPLGDRCCP